MTIFMATKTLYLGNLSKRDWGSAEDYVKQCG